MSRDCSVGGIDEKDIFYFKVYKVVSCEARHVLHYILCHGCPKDPTKSFEIYAKDDLKMEEKKFIANFNATLRSVIKSDPTGETFDVSLLGACIRHLCRIIKPKQKKTYIEPILEFRNKLIHNTKEVGSEKEMSEKISELRNMLAAALRFARDNFQNKISDNDIESKIKAMDQNIKDILECKLPMADIETYKKQFRELREAKQTLVRDSGVKPLKENFKTLSNVDPASWLTGEDRLEVDKVFTRLEVIPDAKNHANTSEEDSLYSIGHEELLQLKTKEDETPTVIVVEGDAGSGKSTLAKFILSKYADIEDSDSDSEIKGLGKYDLVLYHECRNKSIGNFLDLLLTSMPQVSYEMTDDDIVRAVLEMKTLVVVDGLDEMRENSTSENLLREMFEKYVPMSNGKLQFLMTTRPHKKVPELYSKYPSVHARLKGIPPERRVEFVKRLHEAMKEKGLSKQDTSKLIDYVNQSQSRLGNHYRLPLNLTLLTYLWADDPNTMNSVTSATSLYVALLTLLKLRLIHRIKEARDYTVELEDKIEELVKLVLWVYLKTHVSGNPLIDEEHINKLEDKCKELKLRFIDMVGPFFRVDTEWTTYGTKLHLRAPHNSIMEFFSAHQIFNCMAVEEQELERKVMALEAEFQQRSRDVAAFKTLYAETKKLNNSLEDVLKNNLGSGGSLNNVDFAKHHNVLLHLGGLLALKDRECLHANVTSLVKYLEMGGINEDQWLDLVAEAECDPKLTALVAEQITSRLIIRDGHTGAALEMFKNLETNLPVQVIFECEVRHIPNVDLFMEKLSERDCNVELLLKNHWKNPHLGNSTEHLKKLHDKECTVTRFTGNLDDLADLSEYVDNLRLTIADNIQAEKICGILSGLHLEYLGVHVLKSVESSTLKPLPVVKPKDNQSGTLWISNVGEEKDDINKACDIASALLPQEKQFNCIAFPRCSLNRAKFEKLLQKLAEKNIRVSEKGGVKTDSENLDKKCVIHLRRFTRDKLKCEFYWGDEASVW